MSRFSSAFAASCALIAFVPTAAAARPAAAAGHLHRFAPSADVTVSFKLPTGRARGTLVRFSRNALTVTRDRRGRLVLGDKTYRAHPLAGTRHGADAVRVTLSRRQANLTLGRKTTRVTGRFVAESTVTVNVPGAIVRAGAAPTAAAPTAQRAETPAAAALGATSGPTRTTAASPVPTPVATAPSTPAAMSAAALTGATASPRLFSPSSVWNAPLAADAPLDPSNARLVKTLTDTVAQNISAGWGPWIDTTRTTPLYVVPADQPTVRVQLDPGSWKASLQEAFEAVPIPADAKPADGGDAHLTVYQPSTDRLWELFKASKAADGWHASFGGAFASVSTSPGYFDTTSWPGLSQSWWGATASSLPVIAGTMLIQELNSGVIPHALAMNVPFALPKTYSWPAQRTDGTSTDANAIPEGARFRLDPTLDIDALNLPPLTKMMAKAAQRYGIIVRDQTGHAISFAAENPSQQAVNPYVGTSGFFRATYPNDAMKAFPWSHLQLLKMDLRPAAPGVTTGTASAVGAGVATVGASVNAHNQATTYRFEYGPTTAYGSTTTAVSAAVTDDSPHPVAASLTGLTPGQIYHYRVVATNATGTTTGADATFTTAAPPATGYRDLVAGTSSLVSYWRLGERAGTVAVDQQGANAGTYVGGVTLGAAGTIAGDPDTSASFNGTTAEMTGSARGLGASGTIEGWFDWRNGMVLMRDHTTAAGWILAYDSGGVLSYRVGGTTFSTGLTLSSIRGGWHHVAVTKNGGTASFYLDGHLVHTGTGAGSTAPVMPWHVMRNGGSTQYATGRADDVAIYTGALSASTIAQHANVGWGR